MESFVRPLEDEWKEVLDEVLRRRKGPTIAEPSKLGPKVAELSRAYNLDAARPRVPLDARIGFSFARDVPKGAAVIRELIASGSLRLDPDKPLRVLDLGAGLGAMSWGIARALEAAGARGKVEALLVDDDAEALAAAETIAAGAAKLEDRRVALAITTRRAGLGERLPEADLVVLGQVLSELDRAMDPEKRADAHAEMIAQLLERSVAPDGSLVIVEPALKERTRHLHAVRDRLAARGIAPFAPCLHAGPCPALAIEGEWCHEDLAVDLPPWLVPVARAAGLRWQGLTFSYLVLRRDARSLRADLSAEPGRIHLRVISERIVTKGKVEIFACTAKGERVRMRRLDRERTDESALWDELARGDVVTLRGREGDAVDERGRLSPDAAVDVWRGTHYPH
jgi:ribosomal protein RSM22 (predicted rRNA methylase)